MTKAITEHTRVCEMKARIVCKEHFISLNRSMNLVLKVLLKCAIGFSICFRWYAFPNFCTQISRPLAYGVRISSKASATAELCLLIEGTEIDNTAPATGENQDRIHCAVHVNRLASTAGETPPTSWFVAFTQVCRSTNRPRTFFFSVGVNA